jgi:hypothetical protein
MNGQAAALRSLRSAWFHLNDAPVVDLWALYIVEQAIRAVRNGAR